MKYATKIGWGIIIGFAILALRRLATKKSVGWVDEREEAFVKSKAKIDATEPSVIKPFIWWPW